MQSLTKGNQTYSYEYDVNGLRTRKNKPDGTSIDYYIVDGQTIAERWNYANGSEYFTMRYVFDQNGSVIGFCTHYPGFADGYFEHYLFAKNLQGDVTAMYTVGSGLTLIATYEYDSWGRVLSVKDSNGAEITNSGHLALRQPFRYRGYHYDMETGYYYLQSRYYDPQIGRFINADSYASTGQGFTGYNMFAYCNNNPVMTVDPSGKLGLFGLGVIVTVGAGLINGLSCAINGDSFIGGFVAGAAGAAVGYAIACINPANALLQVGARMIGSTICNFGTILLNENQLTDRQVALQIWDVIGDGLLSTMTYYYAESIINQTIQVLTTAGTDAAIDFAESLLYSLTSEQEKRTSVSQNDTSVPVASPTLCGKRLGGGGGIKCTANYVR